MSKIDSLSRAAIKFHNSITTSKLKHGFANDTEDVKTFEERNSLFFQEINEKFGIVRESGEWCYNVIKKKERRYMIK